jgi:hypothetical protein
MKRSKYTDEQILAIVKEDEAGRNAASVFRRYALPGRRHERADRRPQLLSNVVRSLGIRFPPAVRR